MTKIEQLRLAPNSVISLEGSNGAARNNLACRPNNGRRNQKEAGGARLAAADLPRETGRRALPSRNPLLFRAP
ncbi:MAG: hypothetical protein ABSF64_16310 [Bryobacteraceae bacterium]